MNKLRAGLALTLALGLLAGSAALLAADPLPPLRRVNAPYFPGSVEFSQTGIFWFGQVTPNANYADVRIGYDPNELFVHVLIFDRLLWYNDYAPEHTGWPTGLTDYDSVTLYLNPTGNVGTSPDQAYRFDGQVSWYWQARAVRQSEYTWYGSKWNTVTSTFATETDIAYETNDIGGLNNGLNNRGWYITFHIPYSDVGLSGPPAAGTVWGLAVALHDRDSAPMAPMQQDEVWPEAAVPTVPSTWGQLYFGTPIYTPQAAIPGETVTIRNGLNGTVVLEAPAGGHTACGHVPPDAPLDLATYWTDWGNRVVSTTYAVTAPAIYYFNVQNQFHVADWPCFSKYYTTFPLGAVPPGKVVISATLALNHFGNAGGGGWGQPLVSHIEVLTVDQNGQDGQPWTPGSLTWNNAPLARENVALTSVDPLPEGAPAVWRTWDVSRAVAEAYDAGQPLRLGIYSPDWDYHSGRYFRPSAYPDEEFRPTLTVRWGEPFGAIHASVSPLFPVSGQALNYTLTVLGSGKALTLTDTLPPEVGDPVGGAIHVEGGPPATYSSHTITWTGTVALGQTITVTFSVTPTVPGPVAIRNTVVLTDGQGHMASDAAVAIVDPLKVWLSLIRR